MKDPARGLIIRAAIIIAAYLLTHLLGFRSYTCVLCATMPGQSNQTLAFLGVIYVILYFATVLIAPIFIIAAGILKLMVYSCQNRLNKGEPRHCELNLPTEMTRHRA